MSEEGNVDSQSVGKNQEDDNLFGDDLDAEKDDEDFNYADDKSDGDSAEEPNDDEIFNNDKKKSSKSKKNKNKEKIKDKDEQGRKRKRTSKDDKETKKKRKRPGASSVRELFDEDVDVADEDEEEEDDYDIPPEERILDADEEMANKRVELRHAKQREFLARSAEEEAARYEQDYEREELAMQRYGDDYEAVRVQMDTTAVGQQARLPTLKDPKLFKVKCKTGQEKVAVRAILLKTMEQQMRSGDRYYKVKSAFCGSTPGYIYVEAVTEALVRDILTGLKMIYTWQIPQVPLEDMPTVMNVNLKFNPIKPGQYFRIKRGVMKGDLARIVDVFEGESRAIIQAIPRISYHKEVTPLVGNKKISADSVVSRPPQALFDVEQANASNNGYVVRRHFPGDSSSIMYDFWNGEYYRHGFLYKEVNVESFIDNRDVNPKLEELQRFIVKKPEQEDTKKKQSSKKKKANDDDGGEDGDKIPGLDDDDVEEEEDPDAAAYLEAQDDLAKEISRIAAESSAKSGPVNPFVPGDMVKVIGGEMMNLVGRVISLNNLNQTARIKPIQRDLMDGEYDVELNLITKHVTPGAHVKVMAGQFSGQTGRVVSITKGPTDEPLAVILTDGINTEIQCNVGLLQMTNEVASGLGNLMGYELYDLVSLNDNESAVVINVGLEKLQVINHLEHVKYIFPQEIRQKMNILSNRSKSFDAQQNSFSVGDTVHVIAEPHAKLTGTVKHINRGTVWLHSNQYLKNSGIFVVKGRSCMIAGLNNGAAGNLSSAYSNITSNAGRGGSHSANARTPSTTGTPGSSTVRGTSRDPAIGTTVRITKGGYKTMLAQIIEATGSHYKVELLAKLKKVIVPKSDVLVVGDKHGSYEKHNNNSVPPVFGADSLIAPSTPYLASATPMHLAGSETPYNPGAETPYSAYGSGAFTPSVDYGDDSAWKVTDNDRNALYSSYEIPNDNNSSNPLYSSSTTPTPSDYATSPMHGGSSAGYGSNFSGFAVPPPPAPPSFPVPPAPAAAERLEDNYIPGMVVLIKHRSHTGKLGVVQSIDSQFKSVAVKIRDGNGRLGADELRFSADEISSADPPKGAAVFVLKGKYKGKSGVVKTAQGKEAIIIFNNSSEKDVIKCTQLAWLNHA